MRISPISGEVVSAALAFETDAAVLGRPAAPGGM
jgi:hypothetical protein